MPKNRGQTFKVVPHHVAFSVADLDASIAWYRDNLGFKLERRVFVEHIPADIGFMLNGKFRVELFQVTGSAPLPKDRLMPDPDLKTQGTKHLALGVPDVKKAVAILRERGVDIAMEREMDDGFIAFIRDNTGNLIELNRIANP